MSEQVQVIAEESAAQLKIMPAAQYHAIKRISKHGLDEIRVSPALYRFNRDNPQPSSKAMEEGTLVHDFILEPDRFEAEYAVARAGLNRTAKVGWADAQAANPGKKLITSDEAAWLADMLTGITRHRFGLALLNKRRAPDTLIENCLFWTDAETGALCKARPDMIVRLEGRLYIVDLKTTKSAAPGSFARSCDDFGYHRQDAFYSDGVEAVFGEPCAGFLFLAVEKDGPCLSSVYELGEASRAKGREQNRAALRTYARCLESGEWPGYSDTIEMIDIPAYSLARA